jgi:ATP-dependent Clp protease adapter protein ClpS/tetratricopeptide (TPR) repeat protein
MPDFRLPARPDLAQERRRAKDLLKAIRSGDDAAIARFRSHHPRLADLTPGKPTANVKLSDAQWVIAREYGFASWSSLKAHIEQVSGRPASPVPYSVVIWNDDHTPMDFVVLLLKQVFGKSDQDARQIMLDTHHEGFAVCAAFDRLDEAEAKHAEAVALVRQSGHPLELTCAHAKVATPTTKLPRLVAKELDTARAKQVRFDAAAMYVELIDGRTLSVPLDWFPELLGVSPDQRRRCALSNQGHELSWEFGLLVSVRGLLAGRAGQTAIPPAPMPMLAPMRSVAACREGLAACSREDAPLAWAAAQADLGHALLRRQPTDADAGRFAEAVAAYRAALEEFTRERAPLDWARMQSVLGLALHGLGALRNDPTTIEAGVLALRAALGEKTRLPPPEEFHTLMCLGNALHDLGARKESSVHLEEALAVFGEALDASAHGPFDEAAISGHQGNTLALLAAQRGDHAAAERAVEQLNMALEVMREREPDPQPLAALFAQQLSKARALIDQLTRH